MRLLSRIHQGRLKRLMISAGAVALVSAICVSANTDLAAPPRFDGAGYSILAEALSTGRGYREIASPVPSRHAHFPPGYPMALGLLWTMTGRSVAAAHCLSCVCTVTATLLAWLWFRRLYAPRTALLLGLAIAANWAWGRIGGGIQSEPLYLLVSLLSIHALTITRVRGGLTAAIASGLLLGATILTRHVGAALLVAGLIDLATRRRWREVVAVGCTATLLVLPWLWWTVSVGQGTQAELLVHQGLFALLVAQSVFYLQRLPDQLTGPVVEIGTVFSGSRALAFAVNLWAVVPTVLVVFGWLRALGRPRRRLAGLSAMASLALLLVWPFTEAGRFLIPLLPFVLVGAVEGLAPLVRYAGLKRARVWTASALLAITLPYSAYSIVSGRAAAQRLTYRNFDQACAWIAREGARPGPVLARHPGEVYWLTGKPSVAATSADPIDNERLIEQYKVAYVLIDDDRYVNAAASPLSRYIVQFPDRVRRVWNSVSGDAPVSVYEVVPPR